MPTKISTFVEILHDTGGSITSAADYARKYRSTRVGTKIPSRGIVSWTWEEDADHLGNHNPSDVLDGSWIRYNDEETAIIENAFEQDPNGCILLNLKGHVQKCRNGSTGLLYRISFTDMIQKNVIVAFVAVFAENNALLVACRTFSGSFRIHSTKENASFLPSGLNDPYHENACPQPIVLWQDCSRSCEGNANRTNRRMVSSCVR